MNHAEKYHQHVDVRPADAEEHAYADPGTRRTAISTAPQRIADTMPGRRGEDTPRDPDPHLHSLQSLLGNPAVDLLLQLGRRHDHVDGERRSVERIEGFVEQMLLDGLVVHRHLAGGQVEGVPHEGEHERIEELLWGVLDEVLVLRARVFGVLHVRDEEREEPLFVRSEEVQLAGNREGAAEQVGCVVAGGGALFTEFGGGGEQAKDGTEVAQHSPGLEAVAFWIVHLELEPPGPHQFREHVHQHIDKPRTELVEQKQRLDLRIRIEKFQHLQRLVAQRQRPPHLVLVVVVPAGGALPLVLGPGCPLRGGHLLLHVTDLGQLLHHGGNEAVHLVHEAVCEFDEGGLVFSDFLEGAAVFRGVPEVPEKRGDVCAVRHLFVETGVFDLPVEQQEGRREG
mmetsp:Transcript_38971/g.75964  ORF Transcript_38971/g.75964 Transcript_38971/m.75964 type:complete len:397 (-) Transcript_38971:2075-3265(-)